MEPVQNRGNARGQMVGDDTIGLPLISLIIQLGHLSQLKLYRLCNFESNYKQCNMKSIFVILIGLILDGCLSVQRVNGWYPVADVPENIIEGKAIVTVKDFDVISLDTVSYPDMAVIEGRLKAEMIQKWAEATEDRIGKRIGFVFNDSVIMAPTVNCRIESGRFTINSPDKALMLEIYNSLKEQL